MSGFKSRVRRTIARSPLLAMLAARIFALLAGLVALRWRIATWPRASIGLSVKVLGWRDVSIGRNVVVGARSWLNVNQRGRVRDAIRIGDNAYIGNENFFSVGRRIAIGDYVLTASRCAFIGSSHIYADPMSHYAGTGTTGDHEIVVGTNCFIGFAATIIGHVRIGHGSIIGAHSIVRSDVPPFSVAVGSPACVVRHYDFASAGWKDGERPQDGTFPDEATYLAGLRAAAGSPIQPISAAAASFLGDI